MRTPIYVKTLKMLTRAVNLPKNWILVDGSTEIDNDDDTDGVGMDGQDFQRDDEAKERDAVLAHHKFNIQL